MAVGKQLKNFGRQSLTFGRISSPVTVVLKKARAVWEEGRELTHITERETMGQTNAVSCNVRIVILYT